MVIYAQANYQTSSTYNLFEDQVTLAGEVYTDATLLTFTNGNKRVIAMAVIPIENFAASGSSNDYFYPNFIPTNYGPMAMLVSIIALWCWNKLHGM